jgi:hypothetical protein
MAKVAQYKRLIESIVSGPAPRGGRKAPPALTNKAFRRFQEFRQDPGVIGFGVAGRKKGGLPTGELSIKVYVKRKNDHPDWLAPSWLVNDENGARIRIDVEERKVPKAHYGVADRVIGISEGTVAAFVDDGGPAPLLLTAAHVAGGAAAGLRLRGGVRVIARVVASAPLMSGPIITDAAVCRLQGAPPPNSTTFASGPSPGLNGTVGLGDRVTAWLSTGPVESQVTDAHYWGNVEYPWGVAEVQNFVECAGYGRDGDSGALITSSGGYIIGIHVAGDSSGNKSGYSYFTRIYPARNALGGRDWRWLT